MGMNSFSTGFSPWLLRNSSSFNADVVLDASRLQCHEIALPTKLLAQKILIQPKQVARRYHGQMRTEHGPLILFVPNSLIPVMKSTVI